MLHVKFEDHRISSFGEEVLKAFTIYGHGDHLGHVTWTIFINFCSPFPMRLHINLALIGQAVSKEKMFDDCGWTTTTTIPEHGYTISSLFEPDGSVS